MLKVVPQLKEEIHYTYLFCKIAAQDHENKFKAGAYGDMSYKESLVLHALGLLELPKVPGARQTLNDIVRAAILAKSPPPKFEDWQAERARESTTPALLAGLWDMVERWKGQRHG